MFLDLNGTSNNMICSTEAKRRSLELQAFFMEREAIMMHEARMAPLAVINRGANELLFENACCE